MSSDNFFDEPKEVHCLKCEKKFMSAGKHIRICPECKQGSTWKSGNNEKVQVRSKGSGKPSSDLQMGIAK